MPRFRMLILCALATCLLLVPAAPAAASRSAESQMLAQVNSYRAKHGLPHVRRSKSLERSAERYSWKQMREGYFGHASRIQASSKYRRLGEILAWNSGSRAQVSHTFHMWLGSSGHRAIIMDRQFRYMGFGLAVGRFQGHTAGIWTGQFGTR